MKYIMLEIENGSLKRRIPIIFPNSLSHIAVAEALQDSVELKGAKVISAGDAHVMASVSGSSSTLNLESAIDDDHIINFNDYGHGII